MSHTDVSLDRMWTIGKLRRWFSKKHGERTARDLYDLHRHEMLLLDVTAGASYCSPCQDRPSTCISFIIIRQLKSGPSPSNAHSRDARLFEGGRGNEAGA